MQFLRQVLQGRDAIHQYFALLRWLIALAGQLRPLRAIHNPGNGLDLIQLGGSPGPQPKVLLFQVPQIGATKALFESLGNCPCLIKRLFALRRTGEKLEKPRLLRLGQPVELVEDRLAALGQARHHDHIPLLAVPGFRLTLRFKPPLPGSTGGCNMIAECLGVMTR